MGKSAEHVDGPRSECPGCVAAAELVEKMVAAARRQLATKNPTHDYPVDSVRTRADYCKNTGDELARMILDHFGIE